MRVCESRVQAQRSEPRREKQSPGDSLHIVRCRSPTDYKGVPTPCCWGRKGKIGLRVTREPKQVRQELSHSLLLEFFLPCYSFAQGTCPTCPTLVMLLIANIPPDQISRADEGQGQEFNCLQKQGLLNLSHSHQQNLVGRATVWQVKGQIIETIERRLGV